MPSSARRHRSEVSIPIAALVIAATVEAATGGPAYCPDAAHVRPAKAPAELLTDVARALQIPDAAARDAAFVRCVGPKLMACYVGANLNCFKADTRRALPGATAWCRENPRSDFVPMSATGHATIYAWSCKDGRAVAGMPMPVDAQGYVAGNWKEVR
jgi:hypothetical protein